VPLQMLPLRQPDLGWGGLGRYLSVSHSMGFVAAAAAIARNCMLELRKPCAATAGKFGSKQAAELQPSTW